MSTYTTGHRAVTDLSQDHSTKELLSHGAIQIQADVELYIYKKYMHLYFFYTVVYNPRLPNVYNRTDADRGIKNGTFISLISVMFSSFLLPLVNVKQNTIRVLNTQGDDDDRGWIHRN